MASELANPPTSTTLDLAGLPEPVVRSLRQLVESLRAGLPAGEGAKPDRPPLLGRFSQPGPSFTLEDFKEARREAWKNFPREFPEPDRG